ncbi:hypothetical protein [Thermococcus sp.]
MAKQYNIPEEHSAKIAELIWMLAQMTKEAIPEIPEEKEASILEDIAIGGQHGYMKNTSTLKELKTHFHLDESVFDKYAPEITRIAEELEQISPFKEKKSDRSSFIDISNAKLEVLSILNGLEFAGFSEEAKKKAIEKLSSKIDELFREKLTPENLQKLGLYAFVIEMIKRNKFDRVKEIKEL